MRIRLIGGFLMIFGWITHSSAAERWFEDLYAFPGDHGPPQPADQFLALPGEHAAGYDCD